MLQELIKTLELFSSLHYRIEALEAPRNIRVITTENGVKVRT